MIWNKEDIEQGKGAKRAGVGVGMDFNIKECGGSGSH